MDIFEIFLLYFPKVYNLSHVLIFNFFIWMFCPGRWIVIVAYNIPAYT